MKTKVCGNWSWCIYVDSARKISILHTKYFRKVFANNGWKVTLLTIYYFRKFIVYVYLRDDSGI